MLKFNVIIYYIGIVLTAIGVLVGFPILIFGNQDIGMYIVTMITPFGFLMVFTGFIGFTLIRPNTHRDKDGRQVAEAYQRQVPD